jgi:hypothetical protein
MSETGQCAPSVLSLARDGARHRRVVIRGVHDLLVERLRLRGLAGFLIRLRQQLMMNTSSGSPAAGR